MTWHRVGGGQPTDDGRGAAPREPVTPSPIGPARAIGAGAAAVTLAAGVAAAILLVITIVVAILVEELAPDRGVDLVARGALASLGILVLIGVIGEPLRRGVARILLARDVARLPRGATPPAVERTGLHAGPHGAFMGAGTAAIIVGAILLPIGLLLATDDREALGARVLVPTVGAVLLAGGIALVSQHRRAGPARRRWSAHYEALSGRWGRATLPVPRAHEQRRHRILNLASGLTGVGGMVFVAGIFMRQPGRWADPVSWDERGEQAIDGLLLAGATVMGAALAVVLLIQAGLLVWTGVRDGRTVRALERGDRVRLEHVDAVLLDVAPLERVGMVLGVVGWLIASYGWAPTFIGAVASAEEVADIQQVTALALPGLASVAAGWLLGAIGAARLRTRRARIQAVLLRDPRPAPPTPSERADRSADAVRDIALNAGGTIL